MFSTTSTHIRGLIRSHRSLHGHQVSSIHSYMLLAIALIELHTLNYFRPWNSGVNRWARCQAKVFYQAKAHVTTAQMEILTENHNIIPESIHILPFVILGISIYFFFNFAKFNSMKFHLDILWELLLVGVITFHMNYIINCRFNIDSTKTTTKSLKLDWSYFELASILEIA